MFFSTNYLNDSSKYVVHKIPSINTLNNNQKVIIHAIEKKADQTEQKSNIYVLYFHGNAIDSYSLAPHMDQYVGLKKANIFIPDYQEYGNSNGQLTPENTYQDALACWTYLTETMQIKPENIFIFGDSLGGAVACRLTHYLRNQHQIQFRGLILRSTFSSLEELIREYTFGLFFTTPNPNYIYNSFHFLRCSDMIDISCLFIHGMTDWTVSFHNSVKLFLGATGNVPVTWNLGNFLISMFLFFTIGKDFIPVKWDEVTSAKKIVQVRNKKLLVLRGQGHNFSLDLHTFHEELNNFVK